MNQRIRPAVTALLALTVVALPRSSAAAQNGMGKMVLLLHVCVYHNDPSQKATSGGYIDTPDTSGANDSVKDILNILTKDPTLALVDKPAGADVSIEVVTRQTREGNSASGFVIPNGFGGFTMATFQGIRRVVFVKLEVPGYTKPLVGRSDGFWTDAAEDVVTQAMKWINLNRETIVSKRPF